MSHASGGFRCQAGIPSEVRALARGVAAFSLLLCCSEEASAASQDSWNCNNKEAPQPAGTDA